MDHQLCLDFTEFKNSLARERKINDKLHIELNKTKNDKSLCENLFTKMNDLNMSRKIKLTACIDYRKPILKSLEEKREDTSLSLDSRDALNYEIHLRKKELGFLESELQVESILQENTLQLFKKKCSSYWYQ